MDKSKVINIVNEMMAFLLSKGVQHVSVEIQNDADCNIIFTFPCNVIPKEELDKVIKTINQPRKHDMEEYYSGLIGCSDKNQFNVVGILVDIAELSHENDNYVIKLCIKKGK